MTEPEPARVPETVLRSMNSNASGSPVLHIPHPDGGEDAYCDRLKKTSAKEKSIECFPPAWRNWCEDCVRKQKEALARADGGTDTDTGTAPPQTGSHYREYELCETRVDTPRGEGTVFNITDEDSVVVMLDDAGMGWFDPEDVEEVR